MTDATLVTGASGGRAPRKGDVLAERYEIVEVLASDSLVVSYRAVDQESDAPVLVRCTAPGLLGEREARGMVERLRPLVGGGGRVVSPVRGVDREGALVLTVEPWPRGSSLRSMIDARRAKGAGVLAPREVLPVVAHLATAIASIPEPYWHGDLRPERVYLDGGGVVLTGGFLLSMLAGDLVSSRLAEEPALAHGLAPELAEGLGGRASDRWGVAALVWEALTGGAPGEKRPVPPAALGATGVELARALDPDPAARPPTLDALVAAISALARMPAPSVEKDAFPGVERAAPDSEETTQVAELEAPPTDPSRRGSTIPAPPAVPPRVLGDAPTVRTEGTTDATPSGAAAPSGAASPNDTAPHAALDGEGRPRARDLDPRLVRAALAPDHDALMSAELELIDSKTDPGAKLGAPDTVSDDLDPALVRAARAASAEPAVSPPGPKPPPKKRSAAVTQELGPGDLEELGIAVPVKAPAPKAPVPQPTAQPAAKPAAKRRRVREPEPVPLPTDIKPIPKPRVDDSDELPVGPVLFDASRPAPATPVPAPAPTAPVIAAPAPAPAAASSHRAPTGVPAWASWAIVAVAVLVAAAIVGAGFWYRSSLRREAERQQLIEQRLREIQSTTP